MISDRNPNFSRYCYKTVYKNLSLIPQNKNLTTLQKVPKNWDKETGIEIEGIFCWGRRRFCEGMGNWGEGLRNQNK